MSDAPDLDALARRYVSLWQEQLSAMAADPELSHNLGRLMSTATALGPMSLAGLWAGLSKGAGLAGMPQAAASQTAAPQTAKAGGGTTADREPGGEHGQTSPAGSADPVGAAAAGPAPDDSGDDMGELHRRLAELEARIAALEAGTRLGRQRAPKKLRNSQS